MNDSDKKSGLRKFIEQNRSLVITIPIFIVLVIVVVLVYVFNGRGGRVAETPVPSETNPTSTSEPAETTPAPDSTPSGGTEVTTLPQDERDKDESEIMRNPFSDPYMVKGIIYDERGSSYAIIEAENKSFIVEAGDEAGGYFKVISIEAYRVTIEVEGQELVLTLSGE